MRGSLFVCIYVHPVHCVHCVQYKETKTALPIFWLVNILIFPKHNYHNSCINFSHVKSAPLNRTTYIVSLIAYGVVHNRMVIVALHRTMDYGLWAVPIDHRTHHNAMLDDMLTTNNKSLNFFYISFDFEVWYNFACNIPFVDYASKLVFVHTVFHCCRFEL